MPWSQNALNAVFLGNLAEDTEHLLPALPLDTLGFCTVTGGLYIFATFLFVA